MIEDNDDQSQQPDQSDSPTETLEDLYGEFQVEQQIPPVQSTQQPQGNNTPSYSTPPDPVTEPEAFKQYQAGQNNELSALKTQFAEVNASLKDAQDKLITDTEERDFRNVAEDIAKLADLDPEIVEDGLMGKFIRDKQFQQIWKNRDANPSAMKKVKTILANEMKSKYSMKTDHQVAENQRALEEANKNASNSKKTESSVEDNVSKMSNVEFDRFVRDTIHS